jgi:hypothetical protein
VAYFLDNLPHHLSGVPPDFVRHPAQSIRLVLDHARDCGLARLRVLFDSSERELGCRPKSGGARETTSIQRLRLRQMVGPRDATRSRIDAHASEAFDAHN